MSDRKYSIDVFKPKLEGLLQPILATAGFALRYELTPGESAHPDFENPDIVVKFTGADEDLLLGNKAELLLALEHIAMECLDIPSEDHSRISFDCNDYRMMRIEELRLSASAAAEKVKRTGSPFFFNPMNSRERRVIHLSMRGEPTLRSESTGSGPHRQVVVYPASMPSVPTPPPPPPPRRDSGRDSPRGDRRFDRRPGDRPGGRGGDRPRGRGPR